MIVIADAAIFLSRISGLFQSHMQTFSVVMRMFRICLRFSHIYVSLFAVRGEKSCVRT